MTGEQPPVAAAGGTGETTDETEASPFGRALWLRFALGSVLIVASMAAATATSALVFLNDVTERIQPIPHVADVITPPTTSDAPQTILLIGSDRRPGSGDGARSDTTMLVRVDPDEQVLSLFSLPRDLEVTIPGVGTGKLNEAYSDGGPRLTIRTVKALTGLQINHVVEVNFQGFADAVDAIGCVYVDVDRDYFHSNEGAYGEDVYSEIDINSGYQRLCGLKALQYVRYRHYDTDIVRAARQQDFLREARQKVRAKDLIGAVLGTGTGAKLIDVFTKYTRSDLDHTADVIGVLKSFNAVRGLPVNQVHFRGDIGDAEATTVTASPAQVRGAINRFLEGPAPITAEPTVAPSDSGGKRSGHGKRRAGGKPPTRDVTQTADVIDADPHFAKYAGTADRRLDFPVFYPTRLAPGSTFSPASRTYNYENENNDREKAYKLVIPLNTPETAVTEYYGVMGTTWDDPPILRDPSETREIDGRAYELFYDSDRLRMVGWREDGNSYWLNNTLLQTLNEGQMLALAASMDSLSTFRPPGQKNRQ